MARQGIVYHGGGSGNAGCRQKRQGMRAVYKEYEDSYINGYADALADILPDLQTDTEELRIKASYAL